MGCVGCGAATKTFVSSGKPAKWCSERCSTNWHKRQRVWSHQCACGATWTSRAEHSSACRRCAARKAGLASGARSTANAKPRQSPVYLRTCRQCKVQWVGRGAATYCSDACRASRARERHSGPLRIEALPCRSCNQAFDVLRGSGARGNHERVCGPCKRKMKRMWRRISGANHRKRARRYGCAYQPVNRLRVFERDQWQCAACHCSTPRRLMGTFDVAAPELDHVVPLSNGGPHSYENCQLLCRACNIKKGAGPMDDLHAHHIERRLSAKTADVWRGLASGQLPAYSISGGMNTPQWG